MIIAQQLVKSYGKGASAVTALAGVDFQIQAGERIAVLGKSGSGKSTILNLLGGLDRLTSGSLVVDGHDLSKLNRPSLAEYRLKMIGFIFQSFHLIPSQSILQNVELPMMLAGMAIAERKRAAAESLNAVGLAARVSHRPADLSGGERQRAAIARALVNRPKILLADEPTGNLDSANSKAVMELIQKQTRDCGMTLILVTHDEELAKRQTDRVIRMADGKIASAI